MPAGWRKSRVQVVCSSELNRAQYIKALLPQLLVPRLHNLNYQLDKDC